MNTISNPNPRISSNPLETGGRHWIKPIKSIIFVLQRLKLKIHRKICIFIHKNKLYKETRGYINQGWILPIYEAKAQEKGQIRLDLGRTPFRISFNNQESTESRAIRRIKGPHLLPIFSISLLSFFFFFFPNRKTTKYQTFLSRVNFPKKT